MELYHVLNRGVDKRAIVMDNYDRLRFINGLFVMNDDIPVINTSRSLVSEIGSRSELERERLVDVHAWCLMGNHYHLLLSERVENGMSKFLQKFNIGYTMYFNLRHARSGVLFQGKTKKILIKNDRHYNFILPYIHCNPLDLQKSTAQWRTRHIANPRTAIDYLNTYRWSSYRNYVNETEFAEILEGSHHFKDRAHHAYELKRFLNTLSGSTLSTLTLEN